MGLNWTKHPNEQGVYLAYKPDRRGLMAGVRKVGNYWHLSLIDAPNGSTLFGVNFRRVQQNGKVFGVFNWGACMVQYGASEQEFVANKGGFKTLHAAQRAAWLFLKSIKVIA